MKGPISYLLETLPMFRLLVCFAVSAGFFAQSLTVNARPRHTHHTAAYRLHHDIYHRQVYLLEQQIRLVKAEIAAFENRLATWERFDRFRNGRPLMITIENTELILMQAKLDLELLEQALFDLVRSRGR